MPIYEYACLANGHKFEVFQKMSDPAPESCPTCGPGEVRKLVSASAFVLKGGGWYRDHYGLKSGSDAGSSGDSGSGSAPAPAASKSTDSAPAAPAAPASTSSGSSGSSGGSSSAPAAS